jgi:toxin ParE1/3/4
MVEIRWSLQAANELEEICIYFDKNSPQYANLFAFKVIESIQKLTTFPEIGRIVPEIENQNIRELFYKSYRIIYRIQQDCIEIVSIFHGSRIINKDFLNSH